MTEHFTREEAVALATQAGFFFHDAGHAPTLHTLPEQYSEKCFQRLLEAAFTAKLKEWARRHNIGKYVEQFKGVV